MKPTEYIIIIYDETTLQEKKIIKTQNFDQCITEINKIDFKEKAITVFQALTLFELLTKDALNKLKKRTKE